MKSKSFFHSFQYALTGVFQLVSTQRNMKIHLAAAAGAFVLAWCFDFSALEYTVLTLTVGMVWTTEAINTAIETAVDLASPGIHPLAKKAKDIAAGAVLISAGLSLVIACLLFWPHIKRLGG